jgi:ribose-phosphate pyrophosphokinase
MIFINSNECTFLRKFGDGTQQIRFPKDFNRHNLGPDLAFTWLYDNEEELLTLYYLVSYYRMTDYMFDNPVYTLKVPYLPNARMDRVQEYFNNNEKSNPSEVFTLKFFANFINSLKFDQVITYDVHSEVAKSLINNIIDWSPERQIKKAMDDIKARILSNNLTICFPDFGAYKRYAKLPIFRQYDVVYGVKTRDWHSREIKSLNIVSDEFGAPIDNLSNGDVLIIDDIISTGGTISRVVKELLNKGAKGIYCYCSHLENSAFKGTEFGDLVHDKKIEMVYTTDSIFRKKNDSVKILEV